MSAWGDLGRHLQAMPFDPLNPFLEWSPEPYVVAVIFGFPVTDELLGLTAMFASITFLAWFGVELLRDEANRDRGQ